jgi:hypothetical protein
VRHESLIRAAPDLVVHRMLAGSAPAPRLSRGPRIAGHITPPTALAKDAAAIQPGRLANGRCWPRATGWRSRATQGWNAQPAMHNVLEPDRYRGSASRE